MGNRNAEPSEGEGRGVGAQLQRARSERRLSLGDVAKATHIQPWVLEALEADRLHELMSPVYVKGFLTTYAKLLKLEPEPLLAQWPWPQPVPEEEAPLPPPTVRFSLSPAMQRAWPRLRRVGVLATSLAALGLLIMFPVRWASRNPAVHPRSGARLAGLAPLPEPVAPKPLPLTLAPSKPLELALTVQRTTWVRIRADGKLLTEQRLQRGVQERWVANKQFEIIVAKPSHVELSLNGQSLSPFVLAHQGRLLITHHGVTRLPEPRESPPLRQ